MFVFTADNHIALRGLRPEIPMEDTLSPLTEIVQYCLRENLPLVLGGDLYDTNNPPARLVARVNEILALMDRKGIPVYAIQGNHDKDPETPWSTIAPGVQWIDGKLIEIGGLLVYGIDFAPASVVSPRIAAMPKCDVVVIHQALRQGLGFDGAWNCDLDFFDPEKVKNVLAGDLHMGKAVQGIWSTKRDVFGIYPGTPYMTTIDEHPFPSFLLVKGLQDSGFLDYTRVPLHHRPFLDLTAATEAELIAGIRDLIMDPKPIVVLRFPTDAPEVLATAKKVLKETFLIESPLPARNRFLTSRNLVAEAREGLTLAKVVTEKVTSNEPLKSLLLELVACRDKASAEAVIASHRTATLTPKGIP